MQLRNLIFIQLRIYEAQLKGTDECFFKGYKGAEAAAAAALDAACPKLRLIRKAAGRDGPY